LRNDVFGKSTVLLESGHFIVPAGLGFDFVASGKIAVFEYKLIERDGFDVGAGVYA
jgi:hypothetical protein